MAFRVVRLLQILFFSMPSTEKVSAPRPSSQSVNAWLSLIAEPDQRWLTQRAILILLQTATSNVEEFGPDEVDAASWLSMMVEWLNKEDGRERGFIH